MSISPEQLELLKQSDDRKRLALKQAMTVASSWAFETADTVSEGLGWLDHSELDDVERTIAELRHSASIMETILLMARQQLRNRAMEFKD